MEERVRVIDSKISTEVENYNAKKRSAELLSTSLGSLKEKYKANENDVNQIIYSVDESFEQYKEEYTKSLEIVIPAIEPLGSEVITSTMLMNIEDYGSQLIGQSFDSKLINSFKTSLSEVQVIVAHGKDARYVKVGDIVKVRMSDFFRVKNPNSVQSVEVSEVPIVEIDNENYLSMSERNIQYIIKNEGYYNRRTIEKKSNKSLLGQSIQKIHN